MSYCDDCLHREVCGEEDARDEAIKFCGYKLTEPKTGYWIKISPAGIYECSECGQNVMTSDICAYKFCHGCGARMFEPQKSNDKCKNCEYRRNPDYTRCHECKAESEEV